MPQQAHAASPRARAAKASVVQATRPGPRATPASSVRLLLPVSPSSAPRRSPSHRGGIPLRGRGREVPAPRRKPQGCLSTHILFKKVQLPGCASFHSAQWHPDIWPGSRPHGAPGDSWETQPLIVIAVQTGRGRDTGLSQGALLPVGRCRAVSPSSEKGEQLEASARQGLSRGEAHADCSTGQSQRHTGFPLPNIHIPNLLFVFPRVGACQLLSHVQLFQTPWTATC